MDAAFWRERWRTQQIGFHEGRPNTFLEQFADRLGSAGRVLVPLCGKTVDLVALAARGHAVVGVELAEVAALAFFAEQGLAAREVSRGGMTVLSTPQIEIVVGDWFATTPDAIGTVSAIYDRAALIALPPAIRRRYVEHLRTLAPALTPGLLVSLAYPDGALEGPPFSVDDDEIRSHYPGAERLAERVAEGGRAAGVAVERAYAVTV